MKVSKERKFYGEIGYYRVLCEHDRVKGLFRIKENALMFQMRLKFPTVVDATCVFISEKEIRLAILGNMLIATDFPVNLAPEPESV